MTKAYKHKLNKKDLKHLRTWGMLNYVAIEGQMKRLIEDRKTTPHEPCYECRSIAGKLGLAT
jgi:hypothetical protein